MNENKLAKIFRLAMVAAILIALVVIATPAMAASGATVTVKLSGNMSIRSGPGMNFNVVDYANNGDTLTVDMWTGTDGWFHLQTASCGMHDWARNFKYNCERWIYSQTGYTQVITGDVNSLPITYYTIEETEFGPKGLRMVEDRFEVSFDSTGSAVLVGDSNGKPQIVTEVILPWVEDGYHVAATNPGQFCTVTYRGQEYTTDNANDLTFSGGWRIP